MNSKGLNSIESLTRNADRAALALGAAGLGEFELDLASNELTISSRLAPMIGLAAGVVRGDDLNILLARIQTDESRAAVLAMMDGLRLHGRHDVQIPFKRPDDGRQIWLELKSVARVGDSGQLLGAVGVVRDISADKIEVGQRDSLVFELDHRIKNVLAAVQSLAAQSARRTVSLDAFLKTFFGRLEAMAAAHTLLTATRWRGAEISQIATAELGALAQGQARWEGPDIVLSPRATHALTLALHELSANAVKHGALSTETGKVDVRWRHCANGGFELSWTETGGPLVAAPVHRGFGSTLLERVTGRELGGSATVDYRPGGVRVVLIADAAALAGHAPGDLAPQPVPPARPELTKAPVGSSLGTDGDSDIRGVRVLIVEDAVLLALELESGLVERGAVVVGIAADLDEALGMLDLKFDIAVLDANLNGRSVIPVADALAARGIPFVFATGYGDAGAALAGFAAPVVEKPYNVRQITTALGEALTKLGVAR